MYKSLSGRGGDMWSEPPAEVSGASMSNNEIMQIVKKIFVIYLKKNRKGYKKLKNNLENIYDEFRKTQEKT